MEFGPTISSLRRQKRLSQKTLAEQCGISQQHLSMIELGKGGVELKTLVKILDALGSELHVREKPAVAAWRERQAAWAKLALWESGLPQPPAAEAVAQAGALAELYRGRRERGPEEVSAAGIVALRRALAGIR